MKGKKVRKQGISALYLKVWLGRIKRKEWISAGIKLE